MHFMIKYLKKTDTSINFQISKYIHQDLQVT